MHTVNLINEIQHNLSLKSALANFAMSTAGMQVWYIPWVRVTRWKQHSATLTSVNGVYLYTITTFASLSKIL